MDFLDWLTIVGGSGGLVYWWDRWRGRPCLSVKILREKKEDGKARVEIEVENTGSDPNSIQPGISFDGWTPKRRHRRMYFEIQEDERRGLAPYDPTRIYAVARDPDSSYYFLWLRRYRIAATRGRTRLVRLRWVEGPVLGFGRYWLERTLFHFLPGLYLRWRRRPKM